MSIGRCKKIMIWLVNKMINIRKSINGLNISLFAVRMGNDFNISILGGDDSQIGAVALAVPSKKIINNNEVNSTSASLLTVSGDREDEVVMPVAKKIAKALDSNIVVSCGIHKEKISMKEINLFMQLVNEAVDEFIAIYKY